MTEVNADKFLSLNLHEDLKKSIAELPFTTMTAIQQKCIPPLLFGQDVVGQAKTGSGKTLAFLIPAVNNLLKEPVKGTGILIIAPTKELAVQIHDVLATLVKYTALTYTVVTGGIKVKKERELLQRGADIVIATPGRLLDHLLHCSGWKFKSLKSLIIDEADRLLADGFQRNMDEILSKLPEGRQTMMFSATNNAALQHLSRVTFSSPPLFIVADEQKGYTDRHMLMFNTPGDIFQSFGAALDTPASKKRKKPAPLPADGANRIWKDDDDFLYDEDEPKVSVAKRHKKGSNTEGVQKTPAAKGGRKEPPPQEEEEDEEDEEVGDGDDDEEEETEGEGGGGPEAEAEEEMEEEEEEDSEGGGAEATRPPNSEAATSSTPVEFPGLVDMTEVAKNSAPTATNLTQYFVECEWEHRLMLLYCFLKYLRKQPDGTGKVIVFFSTAASVLYHQQMLARLGIGKELEHGILVLSGKMKLRQRLATFRHFVGCQQGILLATDVAARGLDIPRVEWIVQFDPPTDVNEYIHRVGRTARAGAAGAALIFLNPVEFPFLDYLGRHGIALQEYDPPFKVPNLQMKFEKITTEDRRRCIENGGLCSDAEQLGQGKGTGKRITPLWEEQSDCLVADQRLQMMGVKACKAFVMSYQAHKLKSIFDANKLDMETVAIAFALDHIPSVQIHRQEKKPYVKGVIKSMMRKKMKEEKWKSEGKAQREWDRQGNYIGRNPDKALRRVGAKALASAGRR